MTSLVELQKMREGLVASRAEGVRRVKNVGGSEVEYKSDSEMAKAIAALDAEIRSATTTRAHTIHFNTSKGI
ncbi:phage head-tail joining protein [Marivita sp. S2033]|uniref:phage head-tail joining protein n=1 Tax=Marivita sp. S2033 TaxID=3373187 RepID=UPI003981F147